MKIIQHRSDADGRRLCQGSLCCWVGRADYKETFTARLSFTNVVSFIHNELLQASSAKPLSWFDNMVVLSRPPGVLDSGMSRGRCTNLLFYFRDCKQILKSMNKEMCSLTTTHIYRQPCWPSIYICDTSRLHICLFLGFKIHLRYRKSNQRFMLLFPVANASVTTETLNFETLKMDFNQNIWQQLLPLLSRNYVLSVT